MNETFDWKKIWSDPRKIVSLVTDNEKSLLQLRNFRKRILGQEYAEEKQVRKGKYVIAGENKSDLIRDISSIDSQLGNEIRDLAGKSNELLQDQVIKTVDTRIKEIKESIKRTENALKKIIKEEKATITTSGGVVDSFISILKDLRGVYKKQIQNIELNQKSDIIIKEAAETGKIQENPDRYINEAEMMHARAKENQLLNETADDLLKQVDGLKEKAKHLQQEFEKETEEIGKVKKGILSFIFRNKKEEDFEDRRKVA